MRAAWLLTRSEVRQHGPGLLLVALLVTFTGAMTLAALAGARRTESSFDRFIESSRNPDTILFADDVRPADVAKLRALPGVEAVGYGRQMTVVRPNGEFLGVGGALDDVLLRDVLRLRILEGRAVRPGAADEVVIGEPLARASGLRVGMTLDLFSYSQAQVGSILRGGGSGKPAGPHVRLRIVGISRIPSDLSLQGADGGLLLLSKAFVDKYGDGIANYAGPHGAVLITRLHDHAAGVPRFLEQVRSVLGDRPFDVDPSALSIGGVQESIDLLAVAVLALGVVSAIAGLIALALVLSRQASLIAARQAPVRDLGLHRRARAAAIGTPVFLAVGLGAAVAIVLAWLTSPLLPIGVARQAEPDPGLRFDALVLGLGTIALVVLVGAVVVAVAWRAARIVPEQVARRPSLLTRALEGTGVAPPARIGVRMALERRSGRALVPVWSSLAGAGVAVLGLVAVAVFGASLQHLQATPSAYGRPWDIQIDDTRAEPVHAGEQCGPKRSRLTSDPDVAAVANACSMSIEIDGRGTGAVSLTPLAGRTEPTILAGRAPQDADEIALGRETLAALHRKIGDHVTGRTRSGAVRYRVVGEVAVPELSDPQAVADGAVLTGEGLQRLVDENNGSTSWYLVARFRTGIDQAAAVARIRALPGVGGFQQPGVVGVGVPLEVERLDQIHLMPLVIGGFLAIVGAIAVGHLLVTSVRRRRRDFAVLKSVGFTRRQVLATVSWQATTVAVVGLLVGAALGVVVGGALWEAIAGQVGVFPDAVIPTAILAGIAVVTVIVVNVIAAFPARSAARTRPAVTLRSE